MAVPVHIFDVCGTLFLDDTTVGFIRWYHWRKRNRLYSLLLFLVFEPLSPLMFFVKVAEKVSGRHFVKLLVIRSLRNEAVSSLDHEATLYVDYLINARAVPEVMSRLLRLKDEGSIIVLASASIDTVVRAVAAKLGVLWVSSELGVDCGKATGVLRRDISGQKAEILRTSQRIDFETTECHGYSDNFSDLGLLEMCAYRTVVLHEPTHLARWNIEGAHFIKLYQEFDEA